jgi:hypothetical protein
MTDSSIILLTLPTPENLRKHHRASFTGAATAHMAVEFISARHNAGCALAPIIRTKIFSPFTS